MRKLRVFTEHLLFMRKLRVFTVHLLCMLLDQFSGYEQARSTYDTLVIIKISSRCIKMAHLPHIRHTKDYLVNIIMPHY